MDSMARATSASATRFSGLKQPDAVGAGGNPLPASTSIVDIDAILEKGMPAAIAHRAAQPRDGDPLLPLHSLSAAQVLIPLPPRTPIEVATVNEEALREVRSLEDVTPFTLLEVDRHTIESAPPQVDTVQLLASAAPQYDHETGALRIACLKTTYGTISALAADALFAHLRGAKLSEDANSRKALQSGALTPLILADGSTVLMKRRRDQNWSVPGGFAAAYESPLDLRNLFRRTAALECIQELLGDKALHEALLADFASGMDPQSLLDKYSRFRARMSPSAMLHVCRVPEGYGMLQIFWCIHLDCTPAEFEAYWQKCPAVDAADHDAIRVLRPDAALDFLREYAAEDPNGLFLAMPALYCVARELHGEQAADMDVAAIPGTGMDGRLPVSVVPLHALLVPRA